jgi:hypothetical protein
MTDFNHKSIGNKGDSVRIAERHAKPASRSKSGAFATLAKFLRGPESGAPSCCRFTVAVALALVLTMALTAAPAFGAETRPYSGVSFGPDGAGGTETFAGETSVTVDQTSGDIYVYDGAAGKVYKFNSEGTPVSFSATGTNAISEIGGGGGGSEIEIAVAPNSALGGTAGDIYVANNGPALRIFAPTGAPLAELSLEQETCGVATDPSGHVFTGSFVENLREFTPSGNPVTAEEKTAESKLVKQLCGVAADGLGNVYGINFLGGVQKLEGIDATSATEVDPSAKTASVDPVNNDLYADNGATVSQYDPSGNLVMRFGGGQLVGSAGVDVNHADGEAFVGNGADNKIDVFGPPIVVPGVKLEPTTGIGAVRATLNGTVNPAGVAVSGCEFEYLTQAEWEANGNSFEGTNVPLAHGCEGPIPTGSEDHAVTAKLTGLEHGGATYRFRLTATNANGSNRSDDEVLVTGDSTTTEEAADISETEATLNGAVFPDNNPVTECEFEYGTMTSYGSSTPCVGPIPPDETEHVVSADLTGLTASVTYHFRLVANINGTTIHGRDKSFTTTGPPRISNEFARPVGRTEATLRAKIDPSGFATRYYFEWGTDASYGNRIPVGEEPAIGSGTAPVAVSAEIGGLQEATAYHFRVVTANSSGTTAGAGQELMTLNSADLPDDRRPELVSPENKRPVGSVRPLLGHQVEFQAAEEGDAVAYPVLNGLADSTAGGEVAYEATRSSAGWNSVQVTPPSLVGIPEDGGAGSAASGLVSYYTPNLSCGLVETFNPLSAGIPSEDSTNEVINLYRWSPADRSYTLLTNQVPLNPTARANGAYYQVMGANESCTKLFFRSIAYEFLPGAGGLYEWDEGTLRDAGLLPTGTAAAGIGANGSNVISDQYRVSRDGRLFFVAVSDEGADAGHQAVFVRVNRDDVVDASQPLTATPSLGAQYEAASPDGSHVLFLANYGLSSASSVESTESCVLGAPGPEPDCDLYDYNVDSGQLADVSADPNPADSNGAEVEGVLDVSGDGSAVYFAARGQLISGTGRTNAENKGDGSANVYRAHAGQLSYVGVVTAGDLAFTGTGALISNSEHWTSQTTRDGQYLLYVSSANLDGANPAGVPEAYLYSAAAETAECISCPPDGQAPHPASPGLNTSPIISRMVGITQFQSYVPRSLSDDGRAFFTTEEALTPDAVEGHGGTGPAVHNNIYEWHDGQVSLLASGNVRFRDLGGPNGEGAFITTDRHLDPRDVDTVEDIYDLQAGGGFPPPASESSPCDPANGACQGPPSAPPSAPALATPGFSGSGNPTGPAAKKRKHHQKKHHKKHKHHKKKHQKKHRKKQAPVKQGDNRAGALHSQIDSPVNFNRGGAK